jgi:hypothetical protein
VVSARQAASAALIAALAVASSAGAAVGDPVVIDVPGMHMQGLSTATEQAEQAAAAAAAEQAATEREQRLEKRPVIDVPGMYMQGLSAATEQAEQEAAASAAQQAEQERESRLGRHITISVAAMHMTGIAPPPTPTPPPRAPVPTRRPLAAVPALPDLTVVHLSLDRGCHVVARLRNRGAALPATAYGARGPTLALTTGPRRSQWTLKAIDPHRRLQRAGGALTWRWKGTIAGRQRVTAVIDARNRLAESDESNNRLEATLNCAPARAPLTAPPVHAPLKR